MQKILWQMGFQNFKKGPETAFLKSLGSCYFCSACLRAAGLLPESWRSVVLTIAPPAGCVSFLNHLFIKATHMFIEVIIRCLAEVRGWFTKVSLISPFFFSFLLFFSPLHTIFLSSQRISCNSKSRSMNLKS